MNHQTQRLSIGFSQDENMTKLVIAVPTEMAKKVIQKALVFATGGSVFWLSTQLPVTLPQKPVPAPTQISAHF